MSSLRRHLFGAIALLLLAVFIAATSSSSGSKKTGDSFGKRQQSDSDAFSVVNRTSRCTVLKAKRQDGQMALSLRNDYDKRITAFAFSMGEVSAVRFRVTQELIYSEVSDDVGINPHEVFERTYPMPLSVQNNPFISVKIETVVLNDGTGDGDLLVFQDIKDARLGEAIQIKRSLRLLRRYLDSAEGHAGVYPDKLRTEIEANLNASEAETLTVMRELQPLGSTNRTSNGPVSDTVKNGLQNGRENILRRIDEAAASTNVRKVLLRMKEGYEKILNRL